jgi:hypothetical protein
MKILVRGLTVEVFEGDSFDGLPRCEKHRLDMARRYLTAQQYRSGSWVEALPEILAVRVARRLTRRTLRLTGPLGATLDLDWAADYGHLVCVNGRPAAPVVPAFSDFEEFVVQFKIEDARVWRAELAAYAPTGIPESFELWIEGGLVYAEERFGARVRVGAAWESHPLPACGPRGEHPLPASAPAPDPAVLPVPYVAPPGSSRQG